MFTLLLSHVGGLIKSLVTASPNTKMETRYLQTFQFDSSGKRL